MHKFDALLKAKQILAEELFGPRGKPIKHELAFHSLDDIINFGPPRGFWTCINEKVIKTLTRIPSDGKEIERTIVSREYNRTVAWSITELLADKKLTEAGTTRELEAFKTLNERLERGVVVVESQEAALESFKQLSALEKLVRQGEISEEVLSVIKRAGVLVGTAPSGWLLRNFKQLSHAEFLGVQKFIAPVEGMEAVGSLTNRAVAFRSITIDRINFAPGDFVIVRGGSDLGNEQYGQIKKVFVVSGSEGRLYPFVDCLHFPVLMQLGQRIRGAAWHNMVMLGPLRADERGSHRVKPTLDLLRHFIPYPERGHTVQTASTLHAIETNRHTQDFKASDIHVPIYPVVSWS
jgi:hypothetical protein